jgi:hypothetical protein
MDPAQARAMDLRPSGLSSRDAFQIHAQAHRAAVLLVLLEHLQESPVPVCNRPLLVDVDDLVHVVQEVSQVGDLLHGASLRKDWMPEQYFPPMEGEKSHLPPVGCSVGLESFPPCYSTGGPPGQVAAVRCAPANAQARSTPALVPGDGPPWTPLDPPGPPWKAPRLLRSRSSA